MTTTALRNARVLGADGFLDGVSVLLQDGRIAALLDDGDARVAAATTQLDLGGGTLLPGFIDVQVNGGGGVLFNNSTDVEALRRIGQAHRRYGTTGYLPTLISDDVEVMRAAIAATREAIAAGVPGVLGIHLEGPYLAPARKGTHNVDKFRVPDAAELALATSLDNGVTLITLAPERLPVDSIRTLAAAGARVFAGHTAGSYDEIRAGLDAGVCGFTHLYNAMSPLQGRDPGAVGAALEDRHAWCGLIVDGVHVHPASLRVALAAKPRGTLFLVTDAMPMVGADSPSFDLYGETITEVDGVVRNAAGALAGSALDMASAVRNSVQWLGVSLDEAARMASLYPAQCLGLDDRYGRIAPGYQADLVLLDDALQVRQTWIAGAVE
ncbi:N-acetylglucosamine-6-phosphate deacetylase [Xanthomonas sp. CFBP 8703]|jgi:N-acetylglucosamine-6-phosphate deacetylase|uniref:N-acetylglucosamine-6-phosphate deacetylase n=1 Tax=Xanthomonas bonasiae TaxID=2810351 RepID=A0ABS3B4W3_9XANT|nr:MULTISPECIES: N-acetylglucosamine-6-phosphate deacetylase [Xanthomonas]MBD7922352.1 N-acetylglucosamine-6-phosphate deacetylase [Xanthomonas surreyensis]MBN6102625.1 N-acetylglucosamine-6-phosphate deacetylase [Xanthomonas bonasiae]MBN6111081.1 N-acetylglucosamine-6-phosphate deacetylase [Xanthomonas bonasiae]NYF20800.1 N-acetylglucosamine-6-phosphate deacetylase [Xanthomonas sp. JAI131]